MGGYRSGRVGWHAKCENCLSIDVRRWARERHLSRGYFDWQWTINGDQKSSISVHGHDNHIELSYTKDGEKYRYPVRLTETPCYLGGARRWFVCPILGCGKRAAKLYLGNEYFACRHCYKLAYQSQSETRWDRAERAANKIAALLIEDADGYLQKPKRMRWRTYNCLIKRFRRYDDDNFTGIMARLERFGVM